MGREALTSCRFYFDEVLMPNRDAYFDGPVTFSSAFNFATSLFELAPISTGHLGMTLEA
jgi:hypothetical protein